jgi:ABC-type nitrate/sulfonate/bicarbonate transport system ATPase subunit
MAVPQASVAVEHTTVFRTLLPWRTARQNVELPLEIGGRQRTARPALAGRAAGAGWLWRLAARISEVWVGGLRLTPNPPLLRMNRALTSQQAPH